MEINLKLNMNIFCFLSISLGVMFLYYSFSVVGSFHEAFIWDFSDAVFGFLVLLSIWWLGYLSSQEKDKEE